MADNAQDGTLPPVDLVFGENVEERYANAYYVNGSHFDVRLTFGTMRLTDDGSTQVNSFHTAIYVDYRLAKHMVASLQRIIDSFESTYGPADLKVSQLSENANE